MEPIERVAETRPVLLDGEPRPGDLPARVGPLLVKELRQHWRCLWLDGSGAHDVSRNASRASPRGPARGEVGDRLHAGSAPAQISQRLCAPQQELTENGEFDPTHRQPVVGQVLVLGNSSHPVDPLDHAQVDQIVQRVLDVGVVEGGQRLTVALRGSSRVGRSNDDETKVPGTRTLSGRDRTCRPETLRSNPPLSCSKTRPPLRQIYLAHRGEARRTPWGNFGIREANPPLTNAQSEG